MSNLNFLTAVSAMRKYLRQTYPLNLLLQLFHFLLWKLSLPDPLQEWELQCHRQLPLPTPLLLLLFLKLDRQKLKRKKCLINDQGFSRNNVSSVLGCGTDVSLRSLEVREEYDEREG